MTTETPANAQASGEPYDRPGLGVIPWWYWVLLVVVVSLPRVIMLPVYPGSDEELTGTVGEMMNRGMAPYRDAIILRGPGLLLMAAASIRVFGFNAVGLNAPDPLCWIATAVLTVLLARRLWGARVAMLAGFVLAWLSNIPLVIIATYFRAQGEPWIAVGWLFAAYACVRVYQGERRAGLWMFLAGAGVAFGMTMKTNALLGLFPLLFGMWIALRHNGHEHGARLPVWRGMAFAAAGGVVVLAPVCAYLAARGALGATYDVLFRIAASYVIHSPTGRAKSVVDTLFPFTKWLRDSWWLVSAFCWAGAAWEVVRQRNRQAWIPVAFWMAGVASCMVQPAIGYHQQIQSAFIAIFAARSLALLVRPGAIVRPALRPYVWLLAALPVTVSSNGEALQLLDTIRCVRGRMSWQDYYRIHYPGFDSILAMSKHIRDTSKPTDTIQVWGQEGRFFLQSQRMPATLHIAHHCVLNNHECECLGGRVGANAESMFVADLKRVRPAFIVVTYGDKSRWWRPEDSDTLFWRLPGISPWFARNYVYDGYCLRGAPGGFEIYRRRLPQ